MSKKYEFETQIEEAFEQQEVIDKSQTLISRYMTAIYRRKKYFKSLRKSAIGGFFVGLGLVLLPMLSFGLMGESLITSAKDVLDAAIVIAGATLFSVALVPIANQTNFTGALEYIIGYTLIICLLPLLAICAPFYFSANVSLKRKALIKDAQKHPELYEDIPLD